MLIVRKSQAKDNLLFCKASNNTNAQRPLAAKFIGTAPHSARCTQHDSQL